MKKVYLIAFAIAVLIMVSSCGQTQLDTSNLDNDSTEKSTTSQSTIDNLQSATFTYDLDTPVSIGDSITVMVPSTWKHVDNVTHQFYFYSDDASEGRISINYSEDAFEITSMSSDEEIENAYTEWFAGYENNGSSIINSIETKYIDNYEARYFTAETIIDEANNIVFGSVIITHNYTYWILFIIEETNYVEQQDEIILDIIDTMVIEVPEEPEPEPIPDPILYNGTGDSVILIENIEPLAVFYIQGNSSGSHFAVKGYDEMNNNTGLFVNTTDPYSGITFDPSGTTTLFEISAVGDWSIEVRSFLTCEIISVGEPFAGNGDNIILISGSPALAEITGNTAGSHFAVKSYGNSTDLLVNTTDPYTGTVKINDSPIVLEIKAVGEWSITMQ